MHDKKDSKCAVFATTLAHCTVHILWFMRSTIVRFWSYKLEHLIIFNSCSVHKCWFNPIFVHFLTLYFPPFIEWMQTHTGNRTSAHTLFVFLFFSYRKMSTYFFIRILWTRINSSSIVLSPHYLALWRENLWRETFQRNEFFFHFLSHYLSFGFGFKNVCLALAIWNDFHFRKKLKILPNMAGLSLNHPNHPPKNWKRTKWLILESLMVQLNWMRCDGNLDLFRLVQFFFRHSLKCIFTFV